MLHLQDAGISIVFAISFFSGGVASAVYSSDNADTYDDIGCTSSTDFCNDLARVRNSEGASAVSCVVVYKKLHSFIQVHAHNRPKASCGHAPGLLKLFLCVYVYLSIYLCLSVRTHVSKSFQ